MSARRSIIAYGITVVASAAMGALVFSLWSDESTPEADQSNVIDVVDTRQQPTATQATTAEPMTTTEPSSDVTEPSSDVTEPSSDVTEPSSDVTEPSSDVTEPSSGATEPSSDALFAETFAGNAGMDRFRRGVFQRNVDVHDSPDNSGGSWQGDHPVGCSTPGDPYTTRPLEWDPDESMAQRVETAFYNCNDHMMTSMGDVDNYSVVWFSPDQTFTNVRRVCWDVNLTNMGNRQWWEVAVVPVGESELFADVDAADLPEQGPGTMVVKYNSINETDKLALDNFDYGDTYNAGTDKATRYQHCLVDNGDDTVTVTQQRSTGVVTFTNPGSLPDGPVTVVFKDHKYTPDKSERSFDSPAYTWHWDNIIVE